MKSFRWSSLVVYLMVLLSIVFGGLLSTLIFGWVNGEEFSPQTFQVRGFEYLQVPLLRVQVLGVERTAPRAANANLGQWIPADAAPPRWDLVRGVSGHQPGPAGDAAILLAYIDSSQGGSAPWDAWNRAHPKLAAEFWPLVAQVARENAYVILPDLFDAAKQFSDKPAEEFGLRLRAAAAEGLQRVSEDRRIQGDAEAAKSLLDASLALQNEVGGRY